MLTNLELASERTLSGTRVLFVSRELLMPNASGIGTYVHSLILHLSSLGCEIEYVVLGEAGQMPCWTVAAELDAASRVVARRGMRLGSGILISLAQPRRWLVGLLKYSYLRYLPESGRQDYRKHKRRLIPRAGSSKQPAAKTFPPHLGPPSEPETKFILERLAAFEPDVVIVNHVWLADFFRAMPITNRAMRVALAPDIMYQRKAVFEAQGISAGLGDWDQEMEQDCLSQAEVILAIQEQDSQVLRDMLPGREVICMPMPAVARAASDTAQTPGRCLFVGSYIDHNILGLRWFLDNVWPIILARDPNAWLHVCGEVCKSISGRIEHVQLLGQVADLSDEYAAAVVCLIPLQVGSGLKIKLVQALSCGRACVSTRLGVHGLPDIEQAGVSVADGPADFAAAVHELLNDDERRGHMQQQALKYVEAHFAPNIVFDAFVSRIARQGRRQ